MAPKKRTAAVEPSTRVTRSSTRRVNADSDNNHHNPEPPKAKKPKKTAAEQPKVVKAQAAPPLETAAEKTIVIEHCKQCNSFKTRAVTVKEGLEKGVAGVTVVVNPEKPRRGCFEIREEKTGEKFISLLDMKRPFAPMKALDMDKVVSDIIEKIK